MEVLLAIQIVCCLLTGQESYGNISPVFIPSPISPSYQLVWSDEFNTDGVPDSSQWVFETGFKRNEEAQWY